MYTFTFDDTRFTAKSDKDAKAKITKYMKLHGKSIYDYCEASKCYYCDNLQAVSYKFINGNLHIDFPYGLACKIPGCPSKALNPVSKEYMINCLGMHPDVVNSKLKEKGKRSFNSSMLSANPSPLALAKLGKNPQSYKTLMASGLSYEDAKTLLSNKGKKSAATLKDKGWFDDPSNNPFSKSFWIKRGLTEAEAQLKVNARNFWVTDKENNPGKLKYWVNVYGVETGTKLFNEKLARAKKSNTLGGRIERYGEEEGTRRHNEAISNRKCGTCGIHSKESMKFFKLLYKKLRLSGYKRHEILFGLNGGEHSIFDPDTNCKFWYDYVVGNSIIEYNGFLWHPRKEFMTADEFVNWRNPFLGEKSPTAAEIEAKDKLKIDIATKHGYNVLEIWDFEVKSDIDTVINKCMEFINETSKSNRCDVV